MGGLNRVTTLHEFIGGLEGGPWYRRSEVATMVGVTPDAILQIGRSELHPELAPKACVEYAGNDVALYSYEQVVQFTAHFRRPSAGAGRPRVWTLEQRAERRRTYDLARYYRRRAAQLEEQGEGAKAAKALAKAEALQSQLDEEAPEEVERVG